MAEEVQFSEDELLNFELQFDETVFSLWPEALRFVLDTGGAHRRCTRRACTTAGECRMRPKEDTQLSCGGSPISQEMVAEAARLALFATIALATNCFESSVHPDSARALRKGCV